MMTQMKSNVRVLVTAAAAALVAGAGYAAGNDTFATADAPIILAANEDDAPGASAGADRSRTFGNEGEGTVLEEAGDADTVTETSDSDPAGASAGVDRSRTRDGVEGTEPVAGSNISETAETTNNPELPAASD